MFTVHDGDRFPCSIMVGLTTQKIMVGLPCKYELSVYFSYSVCFVDLSAGSVTVTFCSYPLYMPMFKMNCMVGGR